MSVKVEKTDNKNEVKLEFTIDAKDFEAGIRSVFNKNAKYFQIPGFRKGKAPYERVEKVYGAQLFYEDAFNEIVPDIYDKAIEENKLEVVSRPDIQIVQMEKGKDLIFTAVVATKPEVKLGKYKGISLESNKYKVTDDDVEHELWHMAEHNARIVSVTDRAAEMGDITVIDFLGSVDGVPFDGGKAEGHELELGSGQFIPGFEEQVVGMKIDEEKDIKVTFPEEYFSKELAGKEAVFAVKLHEIKVKEFPEIDDEFAKDVSEFDTIKELKADIKEKAEKRNADRTKNELEEEAVLAVAKDAEVDIPNGMIELELDGIEEDMNTRLSYQGVNLDQYLQMIGKTKAEYRAENKTQAEESIKIRLVLEALVKAEKIEADKKAVDERIAELAKAYGRKEDELKKNADLISRIEETIKNEAAIKLIVDNAKVKENEVVEEHHHDHGPKAAKKTAKKETKKESKKEDKAEEKPAKKETKKSSK